MKVLHLTIRSWTILFLIFSSANVIHGQDAFALATNGSLSSFFRSMWSTLLSFFRRPRPRPTPIQAPVKAPVKVQSPVVTPKAVPIQIPTPKVAPVPIPKTAPFSIPLAAPVRTPMEVPLVTPIRVPVPIPLSAPKKAPVLPPALIPVSAPIRMPIVAPKSAPFLVPLSAPKIAPALLPAPIPVSAPVKEPSIAPKSAPLFVPSKISPVVPLAPMPVSAPIPRPSSPIFVPITSPIAVTPEAVPLVAPLPIVPQTTILYTHGDAPYAADQAIRLEAQMKSVPNDAEFIVFVGDLRKAGDAMTCRREEYEAVARLFRFSPVPVFVLIGDNDANDCPNIAEGQQYWNENFLNFESRYWNHTFPIRRQDGYPDNFAFTHKKSLFIGLNIIGGMTRDTTEWELRLSSEAMWTMNMIRDYLTILRQTNPSDIGRIVIFGHADPGGRHAPFFQPLASFIENELMDRVPILYVNGDKHEWTYTSSFYGKSSWLRVGVEGLATDPLLKVTIDGNSKTIDPVQAFVVDRRL